MKKLSYDLYGTNFHISTFNIAIMLFIGVCGIFRVTEHYGDVLFSHYIEFLRLNASASFERKARIQTERRRARYLHNRAS